MNNRSSSKRNPQTDTPAVAADEPSAKERIAKRMARAGLCSRREAERWIAEGRVTLNGKLLDTPAVTVGVRDRIEVDGKLISARERTRLWLFHKPSGTVSTNNDPEGRKTIYELLPKDLPRVMSVGRLDINTEGLLLLTNDGGLARTLELPSTGWLRRYRVRVHGTVKQSDLDRLKDGIAVEGVLYGSIEAFLEHEQGSNSWLSVSLREGKNREIKKVLGHLGLSVNRLIRVSFGPFQLGDLPGKGIREIRSRTLREQLGEKLIAEANADFEAPIVNLAPEIPRSQKKAAAQVHGKPGPVQKRHKPGVASQENLDRMTTGKPKKPYGKKATDNSHFSKKGKKHSPASSRIRSPKGSR